MQSVFFGTIEREVGQYRTRRLKNKIRRLRKKVAGADLLMQEQKRSRMDAGPGSPTQSQVPEQGSVARVQDRSSNPPSSAHLDKDLSVWNASSVEFDANGISVDASLIADGLGLDPASVSARMGKGEIRAVCERGIDSDEGLYRLTFFRPGHRVRLIVGTDGRVRQRSSTTFGKLPEVVQRFSA